MPKEQGEVTKRSWSGYDALFLSGAEVFLGATDNAELEKVQRKAIKMIRGLGKPTLCGKTDTSGTF